MRVVFLSMGLAAVMSLMTGCSSTKCESVCEEANSCDLTERPIEERRHPVERDDDAQRRAGVAAEAAQTNPQRFVDDLGGEREGDEESEYSGNCDPQAHT